MSIPPLDPELDRLLSDAFRHLKLERYDEAAAVLASVQARDPHHPAVLEFEGDLAFARRHFREAQECYRRAREVDPTDPKLEDKFATAVLKVHEPVMLAHMPVGDDEGFDIFWGQRRARPPIASALFSALFSGCGQLYNGETAKGWALIIAGLGNWTTFIYYWSSRNGARIYHGETADVSLLAIIGDMFHGAYGILTVLFTLAWLYSIVDAYRIAHQETEAVRQQQMQLRMDELMAKRKQR